MSLILKQEDSANVPTPAVGKGTLFLTTSSQVSVKTPDGNTSTFVTTASTTNTQVLFNDQGGIGGNANFTFNKSTSTLTLTGNVAATGVKTDNLYYANGQPWDLSDPGGSNTQIQFNDDESFGASANFTWNNSTSTLNLIGIANVTGDINVSANLSAGNVNAGNSLTANYVAGTLTTSAQPNITSVGTLTNLSVSGNAEIGGNLKVNGNVTYINVETFDVEDPIISVGGGPNGDPLTTNDGKDRGTALQYYTSAPVTAFMGWDNSNGEFAFGSNVSIVNDTVTYNSLGNVRASNFLGALTGDVSGNISGMTANLTGNITSGNANLGNLATAVYFTGTLTTAYQPNITTVGTLTSLEIGATADKANDFPNAKTVSSQDNTGDGLSARIGLVGEGVADSIQPLQGFGLYGVARANGAGKGTGVQGTALVTNTADTGAAVGVRGYATDTHSGGYNIGVLGNAIGSGVGNYAFYVQNGGIASIENATFWDLTDNSNAALTFNSTGKANIFGIETTDNAEGIFTSGYLNVVGNIAAGGVKTDNLYYANGTPWDLQEAAGSNNEVQFNSGDNFAASANFTFNPSTNVLTVAGNIAGQNVNAGNLLTANYVAGTLTTNAQPNITSVGTLTSLDVTGNVSANYFIGNGAFLTGIDATAIQNGTANVRTFNNANVTISAAGNANVVVVTGTGANVAGTLDATGNVSGGNLTTIGVVSATGNVSGGNLTTTGVVSATGNVSAGNLVTTGIVSATGNILAGNVYANSGTIGASLLTGTLTTAAQPNITSVGTLSSLGVSGNVTAGNLISNNNVVTDGITNKSGNLTISANSNVNISITGGGVIDVGNSRITDLATPTSDADAATKLYVDNLVSSGIHYHQPVRVESPIALNATYNNGTSGVGATLTNAGANVALQIDGISLNVADRVLVYQQANAAHNGVYVVSTVGDGSTAWVLTRASDADTYNPSTDNGLDEGSYFFVQEGVTGAGESYVCSTVGTITFGTTSINFAQFSKAPIYTAGTGLGLYGNNEFYLANTTVTAASYGNGDRVATFTVNAQGQLTAASNAVIAANAANLTGTTLASGITTSSLTTVGTLGTLSVSGNANVGNIGAATGVFTTVAGSLTTAAQPNITSVGTLTGLAVNGNITAANITANTGVFTGNGSGLTALNASNLSTGTVPSARLSGSYSISVDSATTAGTVTTAAQPNITSVGTLTSLSVSGALTTTNITTGANTTAGSITGNWTLTAGSRFNATYADLAERYVADAHYEPGTVLLFGGEHEVTALGTGDSTRVAGVVTTNPAYLMNSECEGEHVVDIALIGRVPVKVQGPVRKGDLLVSSEQPGFAKVNNEARAGTIIGKALQNYNGPTPDGVIEAMVGRC